MAMAAGYDRDLLAEQRDSRSAQRDIWDQGRDAEAGERDEVALERDLSAVHHDGVLLDRVRLDQARADAWEDRASLPDAGSAGRIEQAVIDREVARSEAELLRQELAHVIADRRQDRLAAAGDRRWSRADRESSAASRRYAAEDRLAAARDRQAAGSDRDQREIDDNVTDAEGYVQGL